MFKLEKPSQEKPSTEMALEMARIAHEGKESDTSFFKALKKVSEEEYLYWDKIKYQASLPKKLSKESFWELIKFFRKAKNISSTIKNKRGEAFSWIKLDWFEELLHELDMHTGGELFVEGGEINKANKQKLIIRGIMEEAIASSQLEGAATSRQAAKKMLREQRKPTNRSEQMILNNYRSMQAIEEKYCHQEMSFELMLELHHLITKEALDSEDEVPRLRENDELVYITDGAGTIYYEAPPVFFVKKELKNLMDFANDKLKHQSFIHPVIKAIMLHFWIGYLHPFTDGNGRLARLFFYWYLIRKGYWAFAYLPISKVIKRSPKQYIMAYVYTEQDDNDLTYFIHYNLKKIKTAIRDFKNYLSRQAETNVQMKQKSELKYHLNLRQVQLLQYLHGNSEQRTTLKTHMNVNQVSKMTARNDLKDLVDKGFLVSLKRGRNVYYLGSKKIDKLF